MRKFNGLCVVPRGDQDLMAEVLKSPSNRRKQQRMRGVREVDPDLHVPLATKCVNAVSIGDCTHRGCAVRFTQSRSRWKANAPSERRNRRRA